MAQLGETTLSTALTRQPEQARRVFMHAYGLGTNVGILLPYSRNQELEADHIGLILMAKAGCDPRIAIPFWQRMNNLAVTMPPEFLSTHPAPEKKIEDIRSETPEAMKYYKQ